MIPFRVSKMKKMSTMGNTYRFPAAALLLAALVLSCKENQAEEPVYSSEEIVLNAAPEQTKGFLSTDALKVNGTQFQMYDYLSGYNGTLQDGGGTTHSSGEEFKYFENTLTFKQDAANWQWLFGDVAAPTSYRWTRTGTHHFYGWLLEDKTPAPDPDAGNLKSSTFFDTYTSGTKTLQVAKSFTAAGPQYDFLYSDVVPVDVINDGTPSHVDIPMKHLFGALGVAVQNTSKADVTVYSVRLLNFPNTHSETLTWNMETGVTLGGGNPTVSGAAFWPNKFPSEGILLKNINDPEGGKTYDAYTGAEMGEKLTYRMCWPMTQAALKPTVQNTDSEGNPVYTADSPLVEVRSKSGSAPANTLTMRFPNAADAKAAITAGKKTQLNVSFADKQVQLSFHTLPWDYEEYPMAFENDAVSATQLKFIEGTYVNGGEITDANGKHDVIQLTGGSNPAWVARGKFSIYTPVNGRLSIGLSGDTDSFIVTLDSGDTYTGTGHDYILIDPNRDGGAVTLGVRPKGVPASGKRLFLHFAVTNNNRDTDADTEINRDKYVITIP